MEMISFALCTTFWLAFGVWNVSYALVIEMREFQVAEVPPGTEICALDTPSYSLSLKSALECALECQRFSYCENFNCNNFSKTCDIFFNRPKCYGPSPSCIHYQTQFGQPYTGIPAENCFLPFTYDGGLYNGCTVNLTGDGCNVCLTENRTIAHCQRGKLSGTYQVTFVTVNVKIPTFDTASLLMSINNWIVIQQRLDGSLSFYQNWTVYKEGFGNISKNFWLGLEKMHQLTTNAPYRLRIEVQSVKEDKWFSSEYDSFLITSESRGYALNVSGYVGDAGDALRSFNNSAGTCQNGMKFSTYDRDNDMYTSSCAVAYTSGYWFNKCCCSCLNCVYNTTDFTWKALSDLKPIVSAQLKASRMMMKAF